jgi:hypothetical protein
MSENLKKQNSFLRVRHLLADELIMNFRLQKIYGSLFEGSELEREFCKLETRYRNETHLKKININRD